MRRRSLALWLGGSALLAVTIWLYLVTRLPVVKVAGIGQQTRWWCWAASGEMIMTAWSKVANAQAPKQSQQVSDRVQKVQCLGGCQVLGQPAECRIGGTPDFDRYDYDSIATESPLTPGRLEGELEVRPITYAYRFGPGGKDGSHMLVGYEAIRKDGQLTMLVWEPQSGVIGNCDARQGAVSYAEYSAADHKLTQYCIRPRSVAEAYACSEESPAKAVPSEDPRKEAHDTPEKAAQAAFHDFGALLERLDRGAVAAKIERGHGLLQVVFATGKYRSPEPDPSWLRPPTGRRRFAGRDEKGWFAAITVAPGEDGKWEPISMFEDLRASQLEDRLAEHAAEVAAGHVVLVTVPGLNLELLGLLADGEVTELIAIGDEPLLGISAGETISLVDAVEAMRATAVLLDGSPT